MKIGFILGEESADRIGADLLRSLRRMSDEPVEAVGLGGHAMAEEGLTSLFDIEELSIIGVGAVVARLPQLIRRIRQTADLLIREKPDLIVIIDSFTFTRRVVTRIRRALPATPILSIVPPAVWAYRPNRAAVLARVADHSICLFPFEPAFLATHGGPAATYVGHPLLANPELQSIFERDRVNGMRPSAIDPTLLILPGSRRGEIDRLMDDFGATYAYLKAEIPGLRAVLPAVARVRPLIENKLATWAFKPIIVEGEEEKWKAFAEADAALAASGTVALELALAGIPMALAYKLDPLAYRLRHMMTGWTAALPNFIVGHPLVPEHFHEFVRAEHLARRLARLLRNTPEREAQLQGFAKIRELMAVERSPGDASAEIILQMTGRSAKS